MKSEPIVIDPEKVEEQAIFHEREAEKFRRMLGDIESYRAFSVAAKNNGQKKPGRPRKEETGLDLSKYRDFVKSAHGDFMSTQVREAVGGAYVAALEELTRLGEIETITKPWGRRVGIYRRISK